MEINGLAVTIINEDKLISTQIMNASQTMKASLLLCMCVLTLCADKDGVEERFLMLGNVVSISCEN